MDIMLITFLKVPLFIWLWMKVFLYTYTYVYMNIKKSFFPQKNGTTFLKKRNKVFPRKLIVCVLLIEYGEKDNNEVVKLPQPILSFLSLVRIFGRGKKVTL